MSRYIKFEFSPKGWGEARKPNDGALFRHLLRLLLQNSDARELPRWEDDGGYVE